MEIISYLHLCLIRNDGVKEVFFDRVYSSLIITKLVFSLKSWSLAIHKQNTANAAFVEVNDFCCVVFFTLF